MISDYILGRVILFAFVLICAYEDYKHKSIDIRLYMSMYILETVFYLYLIVLSKRLDYKDIILGSLPGIVIYLLSKKGLNIGEGDAHFFVITGVALGFIPNIELLLYTLILVSFAALYIICLDFIHKKNSRYKTLPMLSFALIPAALILFI